MPIQRTKHGFTYEGPMVLHTMTPEALVTLADDDSFDDIAREMLLTPSKIEGLDGRQFHIERVRIDVTIVEK